MSPTEELLAEIRQMVAETITECTKGGGFVEDAEAGPKWCERCGLRRHEHPGVDPSFET